MTNEPTSPASCDALKTDANLTTLDPSAGYLTVINTYAVAPERAEALLELLIRATEETLRYVPAKPDSRTNSLLRVRAVPIGS